ncbi:MAG: hypothetical protein J1F37_03285 [Oscillospiraceae bacterium]|nr:hypothetical protein [Oscillospiraceae bacterium]
MNMDIKDLIAKLKSKSGGSRTSGGVASFFQKNPKMKIIIPAVFIVISILVSVVIVAKTGKAKVPDIPVNSGDENAKEVEVLPEDIRESENLEGITDTEMFNEAVLAHPKVTAIIYNSEGYYTATVVTDNAHYPNLSVGQYVAGSDWLVESITEDQVVFSCNDQKITVKY